MSARLYSPKHEVLFPQKHAWEFPIACALFTPCKEVPSLLEAVAEADNIPALGDVALLSPAWPGLDQFRNVQYRGQDIYQVTKSIGGGWRTPNPHMSGVQCIARSCTDVAVADFKDICFGVFVEEKPRRKNRNNQTSNNSFLTCRHP